MIKILAVNCAGVLLTLKEREAIKFEVKIKHDKEPGSSVFVFGIPLRMPLSHHRTPMMYQFFPIAFIEIYHILTILLFQWPF